MLKPEADSAIRGGGRVPARVEREPRPPPLQTPRLQGDPPPRFIFSFTALDTGPGMPLSLELIDTQKCKATPL